MILGGENDGHFSRNFKTPKILIHGIYHVTLRETINSLENVEKFQHFTNNFFIIYFSFYVFRVAAIMDNYTFYLDIFAIKSRKFSPSAEIHSKAFSTATLLASKINIVYLSIYFKSAPFWLPDEEARA